MADGVCVCACVREQVSVSLCACVWEGEYT